MAEPLVVGSEHLLEGYLRDRNSSGTLVAINLTGATLAVKIRDSAGNVKSVVGTPDGDQSTNTGKYTAQLAATDIAVAGKAALQMWITLSGRTHKSKIVERAVVESLA